MSVERLEPEKTNVTKALAKTNWWQVKALHFSFTGDCLPDTPWQWLGFLWSWDIFFGPVPFCKILALVCLLISVLLGLLV